MPSSNQGAYPVWDPGGNEIIYVSPDGITSVALETEPDLTAQRPQLIFELDQYDQGAGRNYDISGDGDRFLMVKPMSSADARIVVVENWIEELNRLLP